MWAQESVTYQGEHFAVTGSTLALRPVVRGERRHPRLYFGGASPAAEEVAAAEANVQLFWGEPLDGVAERIERLTHLSEKLGREQAPLEFGPRVTTLVRETTEQAWADAEVKVAQMAKGASAARDQNWRAAVGQRRLLDLAARGEVLDGNLYTTPGTFGGGRAGTTWLVGSPEDVASSLRKYQRLGVTHFALSDTPYLGEIRREGEQLLPLLRTRARRPAGDLRNQFLPAKEPEAVDPWRPSDCRCVRIRTDDPSTGIHNDHPSHARESRDCPADQVSQ